MATSTISDAYGPSTVKRRRRSSAELAEVDAAIVAAVTDEHPVTLRGVYYRVVSAGAVDKTENGYRLVGRQLIKLRRSGVIPHAWITDGTRWVTRPDTWANVDQMLKDAAASYRRALWHGTPDEVLFFTEKDAISGVILPVTDRYDVPLGVLRGYSSESFAHSMAESIISTNSARTGRTFVYQLGDHDPSGVDAWRDFASKVTGFLRDRRPDLVEWVAFERLAVTEEQILELNLPTRPTKTKDSRSRSFTGESVEVDAIPARTLRAIVTDAIEAHLDPHHLEVTRLAEEEERELLYRIVNREVL